MNKERPRAQKMWKEYGVSQKQYWDYVTHTSPKDYTPKYKALDDTQRKMISTRMEMQKQFDSIIAKAKAAEREYFSRKMEELRRILKERGELIE